MLHWELLAVLAFGAYSKYSNRKKELRKAGSRWIPSAKTNIKKGHKPEQTQPGHKIPPAYPSTSLRYIFSQWPWQPTKRHNASNRNIIWFLIICPIIAAAELQLLQRAKILILRQMTKTEGFHLALNRKPRTCCPEGAAMLLHIPTCPTNRKYNLSAKRNFLIITSLRHFGYANPHTHHNIIH